MCDPNVTALQGIKKEIDEAASKEMACDVKTVAVLKVIQQKIKLPNLFRQLEVRLIKHKDEGKRIVMNRSDNIAPWSGLYHVYLVVRTSLGKALVIDPYVGDDDCYANTEESEVLKSHWQDSENLILETLAPTDDRTITDFMWSFPQEGIDDYFFDTDND